MKCTTELFLLDGDHNIILVETQEQVLRNDLEKVVYSIPGQLLSLRTPSMQMPP